MRDLTPNYRMDPFCEPYWKWEVAGDIHKGTKKVKNFHDPVIRAAVDYLNSSDQHRHPAIDAARRIFEQSGLARSEIEARILSGQTDKQIAICINTIEQVVATYHDLFFDVRPHLRTDWVRRKTVGNGVYAGFKNDEVGQLWAFFALSGGARIVNELIDAYRRSGGDERQPTLSTYFRGDPILNVGLLANIAIQVIPSDEAGDAWCLHFDTRQREVQNIPDAGSRRKAVTQLQAEVIRVARNALSSQGLTERPAPPTNADSDKSLQQYAAESVRCILDAQQ